MMPFPRMRGLIRVAVSVAAFATVAAVAYEAGARGIGTGAWHATRTANKETRAKDPAPMSEVEWTITTSSSIDPTRSVWRAMDAQGELLAAQAALFLGAEPLAAHHLHLAAGVLRAGAPENVQKAAKELDKAAKDLEKGKATDKEVGKVIEDAYEASSSLGEGAK